MAEKIVNKVMCDLCDEEIDLVNDFTQYYKGGVHHQHCYEKRIRFENDPVARAMEIVEWLEVFISFNVPYDEKSSPKNRIKDLKELIQKMGD